MSEKRRGRPEKSEAERLSEVISFRATKAEADELYARAIRLGVSTNTHLRDLVRRALAGVFVLK